MAGCAHEGCRAHPKKGQPWCFFHDPYRVETTKRGRETRAAAAIDRARRVAEHRDTIDVRTHDGQLALVVDLIAGLREGMVDPKSATAIAKLLETANRILIRRPGEDTAASDEQIERYGQMLQDQLDRARRAGVVVKEAAANE